MRPSVRVSSAVCVATLLLGSGGRAYGPEPSPATIAARAFVITDAETLAPFTFDRAIAAVSSAESARTWLETMTPVANDSASRRPVVTPLAGFIATADPGYWRLTGMPEWSHVRPIAIVNRFDLAPEDYSHCGEYRLIFSRRTTGRSRLNIAIEVALPNPHPREGKAGCAEVAAFWWELARITSAEERRDRLEQLFFGRYPGLSPVLDQQTFERGGRIRTSEISDGRPAFAQFEVKRHPAQPYWRLTRVPLDNMPSAALFAADVASEEAASFRREFVREVGSLSIPDVNRYSMNVDRAYSVSDVAALVPPFNYQLPFRRAQRTRVGQEFREQIAEELRKLGSPLTPEDIIARAETQNCAGCHGKPGPVGGDLIFPDAFEQGEHLEARSLVDSARLSPALKDTFLPYRIRVLRQFLKAVAPSALQAGTRKTDEDTCCSTLHPAVSDDSGRREAAAR